MSKCLAQKRNTACLSPSLLEKKKEKHMHTLACMIQTLQIQKILNNDNDNEKKKKDDDGCYDAEGDENSYDDVMMMSSSIPWRDFSPFRGDNNGMCRPSKLKPAKMYK